MSRKVSKKSKSRSTPKKVAKKAVGQGKKKFNKKELLEFRNLILKRKEQIIDGIKHISDDNLKKSQKEASGDISGYSYHMADVATDTYNREFSLGLASAEREELYELDDAMKKIEEGTFGVCEDCKCLMTKSRLKAIPCARLCVKCKENREKR